MSSSAVRMGRTFVEIGADATKLFKGLQEANARMGKFASGMRSLGSRMAGIGTAMAAPFAAAVMGGSRFEDVLLNMKASTGATAQQMDQVRSAAMGMSAALGVGPTEAASGFLELLKAGMSVEQVLGGAGEAAVQFAKVGEMAVADAAVVMADAMAVFGVGGAEAANTLSAAADASSTSIPQIAQAFTQVSAVAGLANQSIGDTAAALAVLANAGVKGSDAGTSLKTMLLRLMSPVDDAAKALGELGLSTLSFRGADGKMRPMVEIIGTLNTAMAGLDQTAKDDIFRRIFGQDAIRAASILSTAGVDGIGAMQQSMADALPVSAKFGTIMSGLSGTASRVFAAMQRLSVAIAEALGPALAQVGNVLAGMVNGFTEFVSKNEQLVVSIAQGVAVFIGAGAAIYGIGAALGAVTTVSALVLPAFALVFKAVIGLAAGVGVLITKLFALKLASVAAAAVSAAVWTVANVALAAQVGFLVLIAASVFEIAGGYEILGSVLGGVRDGVMTVAKSFSTMRDIGVLAFSEIMSSIQDGDIGGAMRVAMDGLMAAFTVGSAAFLNAVDEWGVNLLNAFDFYISSIPFLRFMGSDQYKFSLFGDSTQGNNADTRADSRFDKLKTRNAQRDANARDAAAGFSNDIRRRQARRSPNDSQIPPSGQQAGAAPGDFLADIQSANGGAFSPSDAERIAGVQQEAAARAEREQKMLDAQRRLQAEAASQAEVAGTFSAAAVGGMGVGSSLQQQMADYAKRTAHATERLADEGVLAAAS